MTVGINRSAITVANFHGAFSAAPLAGGGSVLYFPEAQSPSGGSSGDPITYVILGPWSQPSVSKVDAEETHIAVNAESRGAALIGANGGRGNPLQPGAGAEADLNGGLVCAARADRPLNHPSLWAAFASRPFPPAA